MSIYNLDKEKRRKYDLIAAAMNSHEKEVILPLTDVDTCLELTYKVISECANGYFYNPYAVSTVKGDDKTTLRFVMNDYKVSDAEIEAALCEIDRVVKKAGSIHTAENKVKEVYKYFVENFKYADDYKNDESKGEIYHAVLSPFLYKKAICSGFAFAFAAVLNRIGVPCGVVSGIGNNDRHAWNIVKLGSKCYQLDVTWDITVNEKKRKKDLKVFHYFLLNDDLMSKSNHSWDKNQCIPSCTDKSKDYFAVEGKHVSTREQVVKTLVDALNKKAPFVFLRCLSENLQAVIRGDNTFAILHEAQEKAVEKYTKATRFINESSKTLVYEIKY